MDAYDESTPLILRAQEEDVAIRIPLAHLRPGMVGVVEATVTHVAPTETFRYRSGGEGFRRRVTLTDGVDVTLVLWGDEVRVDWVPGTKLTLHGPTVAPAYRGDGFELTLGAAHVEAQNPSKPTTLADW